MIALFVHGSYGYPRENWFPWLKEELEKQGFDVIAPQFPTPENQSLASWLDVWKDHDHLLDEDSIVIGHSIGPAFLLSMLEQRKTPIKAAYFVAGFASKLDNEFDEVNHSFTEKEFDWNTIRENCKSFHLFHSSNDPYVPLQKAEELEKHLQVKSTILEQAGHINEDAGFTTFPELLEKITQG